MAHDKRHRDILKINEMKKKVTEVLKCEHGYKADVSWVSKNIPFEKKENGLLLMSDDSYLPIAQRKRVLLNDILLKKIS